MLTNIKPIGSTIENGNISIGFELEYTYKYTNDTIPARIQPVLIKNFMHDTIYRVPIK